MADKPDPERFYNAVMKILCKKLGVKIEYKIVPRRPEDGDALCRFDDDEKETEKQIGGKPDDGISSENISGVCDDSAITQVDDQNKQ